MNTCPCCSTTLLRHARHSGVYWFCSHCWQEMPDLSAVLLNRRETLANEASRARVRRLERLIDIPKPSSQKAPLPEPVKLAS